MNEPKILNLAKDRLEDIVNGFSKITDSVASYVEYGYSKFRNPVLPYATAFFIATAPLAATFPVSAQTVENKVEGRELAREGLKLTDGQAKELEQQLSANPDDLSSRTKLLGYYFLKRSESEQANEARQKHILWIIENYPGSEIAGQPFASLLPQRDGDVYYEAKRIWLKQVETENPSIIGNAAQFLILQDRDVAEDLFRRVQALEPYNPKWPDRLAHIYALGLSRKTGEAKTESARKSLEQHENALSLYKTEEEKFYKVTDIVKIAFDADELKKAEAYATDLLDKAPQYETNWNYGNAIHHGNLALGRLALKSGDIEAAKQYLIEAGKTTGSPQLNSFGPNMTLAKELLEKGEREAVIEYFGLCSKFWKLDNGRLDNWTSVVKGSGIPDFRQSLNY